MTPESLEWIRQGGLLATTCFGLFWAMTERRDRMRERDANAAALKAAQDQAVSVGVFMADIKNALLRVAEGLQQVSHRMEDIT